MNSNKKSISRNIIILPLASLIFISLLLVGVSLYSVHQAFEKQKQNTTEKFMQNLKESTKEKVHLAYVVIDALYKKNLKFYKNQEKAKKATIKDLPLFFDKFRWDKKGYIFIFSVKHKGVTIYHINHKFMKMNRWNLVRHGQKIIQIIYNAGVAHPNGTYVKYIAYNPDGKPLEKISYLKVYKPLDIIIGSGVYLNYLDKDLLQLKKQEEILVNNLIKNIIIVSIISLIMIGFIVFSFAKKLQNLFIDYENEIQKDKEKFKKKAYFDNLTGLYTRYGAKFEFEKMKKEANKNNKKLSVLFVDLDNFKEINDSLGHEVGDELLQMTANRLKKCVKANDKVIRFGGDEFVIILYDSDAIKVAKLILITLKYPYQIKDKDLYISASIGITEYPKDAEDFQTLIRLADYAMYKSKLAGKDRYFVFQKSMSEEIDKILKIKNEIRKAIEKNEFEIYFQPQIDKFEKTYGAEVLIRWNHPELGVVSPFYFIPLAIKMGIIDKIDLWVIEETIKQQIEWQKKGYYIVISCNVTIYEIEKGDLFENLKNLFEKYKLDKKYINIEVTEEGIMKNPELSIKILNKIDKLGIKINIDDFGTGYSSFAYLKKLPISKLKIDREFIKNIPDDKDDEIIAKSMITLAKNMNLKSVAEGVETQEQKDFVFSNGCDYIQGYFYSPPIPADEFEEKFLKDR